MSSTVKERARRGFGYIPAVEYVLEPPIPAPHARGGLTVLPAYRNICRQELYHFRTGYGEAGGFHPLKSFLEES